MFNKSYLSSYILLVFPDVVNFRYVMNFRFFSPSGLVDCGILGLLCLKKFSCTVITKAFLISGEWDGCTVEITNIPDSMGWGTFGLLYMDQESSGMTIFNTT